MRTTMAFFASIGLMCATSFFGQAQSQPSAPETTDAITLPAGTRIELANIAPVWSRSAKPGDPLYLQIDFPVLSGSTIALPPGSYVQARIESLTRPTRRTNRAEMQVLFTSIIFASRYAVALPDPSVNGSASNASAAQITIQVSTANDLLLDNGAQIEMTLAAPLTLDAQKIAEAARLAHAVQPNAFKTATRCQPTPATPGTPGSPDTVIPGTPGTPSTTVPGGPGMPDIVIPGSPATPPTVIPGSPGTPGFAGIACPAAPLVLSSNPITLSSPPNPQSPQVAP